jgi:hypothetical protein
MKKFKKNEKVEKLKKKNGKQKKIRKMIQNVVEGGFTRDEGRFSTKFRKNLQRTWGYGRGKP